MLLGALFYFKLKVINLNLKKEKMPSTKNIKTVEQLAEKLNQAKSVVLTNYCGLNVEQITKLRREIKKAGGEFKVAKNTLISLSLKKSGYQLENDNVLTQSTALLFCYQDEISPIKALYEFFKTNELPKIKLGFLDKQLYPENKIIDLAQLPSLEILKTKLVISLSSPLNNLVYVLKTNLRNLTLVLDQIKKQKQPN